MIALLGALFLILLAAPAFAQCPPSHGSAIILNFQVLQPEIVYHHDVDIFNLSPFKNTMEKAPTGYILGLTRNPTFARMDGGRISTVLLPDGRVCVWVAEVDASVGDATMDVFIASNYVEGTCEYNVVRNHENTHVAINLEGLRVWVPAMKAALSEAALRKFPIVTTPDRASDDAGRVLWSALTPVFKLMENDLIQRNGVIDTPANYHQTSLLCKNWLPPGTKLPEHK